MAAPLPMCQVPTSASGHLDELADSVHCTTCNIDLDADLASSVELAFTPNASIREVDGATFCFGGPMATPHVEAQQILEPGVEVTIEVPTAPGQYRLRCVGIPGSAPGRRGARSFPRRSRVGRRGCPIGSMTMAPGASLSLRAGDERRVVVLERPGWAADALVAIDVISRQRFRDLFARETLRAGQEVSVGSLTILFTDLVGSTAHYRAVGDAVAFGQVLDHLRRAPEEFAREGGSLVKTIGDGAMGAFRTPAAALRAHDRARRRLAELRPPFRIKAGVHTGPVIAVTLNDRLDYFGTTVNLAARLEAESSADEAVVSAEVAADPEVASLVADLTYEQQPLRRRLKGVEDEQECVRLVPGGPARRSPGRTARVTRRARRTSGSRRPRSRPDTGPPPLGPPTVVVAS